MSRQKAGYARSLAELVLSGELDLAGLPADDEEAIALLTRIKGIGRWSAEIYLLFAEGRPDVLPAGDLAVQIELGRLLGLPEKPTEKQLRELAEPWRPHRGAAAVLAWHSYNCGGALGRYCAHAERQCARAEAAEDARAEVEAQRRHLLALGVAADQVAGRGLALAAAPAIERVERRSAARTPGARRPRTDPHLFARG